MRAAEDDRVDVGVGQRLQVAPSGEAGHLPGHPALLGKRHEEGRRPREYAYRLVFAVNCALVRAGRHGAGGREDPDAPASRSLHARARARLNDPDDRNVERDWSSPSATPLAVLHATTRSLMS